MKKLVFIVLLCCQGVLYAQRLQVSTIGTTITKYEIEVIEYSLRYQNNFYRKQFDRVFDKDIKVKVFGDYSDFYNYANKCCSLDRFTTAFFIESAKEIVVFKNEEFTRSLKHEISHALTVGLGLHQYPWLDEGLAEVMSAYRLDSLGELKQEVLFYTDSLKISYRTNRELTKFLSVDREVWDDLKTNDSYGMGWALVNYLYQDDRFLLTKILDGVSNGVSPAEVIAAQQKNGLRLFFRGVKRHYRRNRYELLETRKEF
ncbi:DUF1570 domain-containing protein [Roseivirga sp.]|uniref:DUF1570 domain-containing protein n=1 Tax=Roseivirga sp. TaxID=1964215 RepID=UPI003B8E42B4